MSLLSPGIVIDKRYQLIKLLNDTGGTSDIWLAYDTFTFSHQETTSNKVIGLDSINGVKVAIKVFRPNGFLDIGDEKFREEFKIAVGCQHLNLITPINFSFWEETPYLVLPYCKNDSITPILGKIHDNDEIWHFIYDVANGLNYLHSKNPPIIHNDIKPANILLTDSYDYAITDFGISQSLECLDIENEAFGTNAYLAPEITQEGTNIISPQRDIWAFGVTLFEFITGKLPFGEDGISNQKDFKKLDLKLIPKEFRDLIKDCLSLDPDARPSSNKIFLSASNKHYKRKRKIKSYWTIFFFIVSLIILLFACFKNRAPIRTIKDYSTIVDIPDSIFSNVIKYKAGDIEFEMVAIEGGRYPMGNKNLTDSERKNGQLEAHEVMIGPFQLGRTEVTQALWNQVMNHNPSKWKGENLPVENVSWLDCQEFIKKLNQITGQRFRLPTEAEWEFAAKGGNLGGADCTFSGDDNISAVGWYDRNSANKTHEVALLNPNSLGIFDMTGNVKEWCNDWYQRTYDIDDLINPQGPKTGKMKIIRGGSWSNKKTNCTNTHRSADAKSFRNGSLGFRLAL